MSSKEVQKQKTAIRMAKMSEAAFGDDQVSEFKEAFEMLAGGKPAISRTEMRQCFKQYGVRISDDEFDKAFAEADSAGDGKLDFPEFVNMMGQRMRQTSSEDKLLKAFRVFDPEGKGFITTKEITEALTTLGNPLNTRELSELLAIAETVPGEVRYQQFINALFMKK